MYGKEVKEFLEKNQEFAKYYSNVHTTLICDGIKLKDTDEYGYNSLIKDGKLQRKTREELLLDATQTHEDFLKARGEFFQESSKAR